MKLGFIGLGIMGRPMALNLVKAGHDLTVFNRSRAAMEELVAAGARGAESASETARDNEIILTMLPDSPDVKNVVLGEGGLAGVLRAGQTLVDMSSIAPGVSREIAAALSERGVEMLDAPVSGGEEKARAGTLAFMVGGSKEAFEKCQPILAAMGASVKHVGDIGAGGIVKLANQTIVAVNIAVIAEALCFARKAGIDPAGVVEAIRGGLAGSTCLNDKSPRMLNAQYQPGFRLKLHAKDLRNVLKTAGEMGAEMPLSESVVEMVEALLADGKGDLDHAALALHYQNLLGLDLDSSKD